MKIEFDIYNWPRRDAEEPNGLQADVYVDGEWVAGWTGPGDEAALFDEGIRYVYEHLESQV